MRPSYEDGCEDTDNQEDVLNPCSKAAMRFYPSWDDYWIIDDIEDTDLSYRVFCNQDIKVQTLSEESFFLAAIQSGGDVTLLFTVGKKQKFPLCSSINCSRSVKCLCFKKYKSLIPDLWNSWKCFAINKLT